MAIKKQDLEVILDSVVTLLQSKLNSKLTAISTEKGDTVPNLAIDNNAYVILGLNQKTINFDPFVMLIATDIKTKGERGISAHEVDLSVLTIKADEGENINIHRTMLRYMRAMEEVFEENYSALDTGVFYNIQTLAPKTLVDLNTNKTFRGAGVGLTFQYS